LWQLTMINLAVLVISIGVSIIIHLMLFVAIKAFYIRHKND